MMWKSGTFDLVDINEACERIAIMEKGDLHESPWKKRR